MYSESPPSSLLAELMASVHKRQRPPRQDGTGVAANTTEPLPNPTVLSDPPDNLPDHAVPAASDHLSLSIEHTTQPVVVEMKLAPHESSAPPRQIQLEEPHVTCPDPSVLFTPSTDQARLITDDADVPAVEATSTTATTDDDDVPAVEASSTTASPPSDPLHVDFFSDLATAMATPLSSPVSKTEMVFPLRSGGEAAPNIVISALSFELIDVASTIDLSCLDRNDAATPRPSNVLAPSCARDLSQVAPPPLDSSTTCQPSQQAPGCDITSPSQSKLFPALIHSMLDEVRIDIARFYIPLDLVTPRVLAHVQRSLADLLATSSDDSTPSTKMSLRRMHHLSFVLGVETILSWLWRRGSDCVQGWLRDSIMQLRGEQHGPTGPLMLTAMNLTAVVLAVQKRLRSKPHDPDDLEPPKAPPLPAFSLVLDDEIGYNQYMDGLYSPRRHRQAKSPTKAPSVATADCPPPPLLSPRRGLHVLMSEHIHRHEYRPIDKHIPRFMSKSSVSDVAAAASRRNRGVRYGNLKGKVPHQ